MSSIKKHFSVGWVAGIALGVACSTFAGSISDTFNTGDTLTAAAMNNIKSAVNGNVTDITALQARAAALETGAPPCPSGMSHVGSVCIDTNLDRADFTGCSLNGTTGCTVVPTNTTGSAATNNMSWAQAARACANAGKRLPTVAEWSMGKISGILQETADGNAEFVDQVLPATTGTALMQATYVGTGLAGTPGTNGLIQAFANINYNAETATPGGFIFFRCAR